MERRKKLWMDGFRAGQELVSRCPYPPGPLDARDWLEGWAGRGAAWSRGHCAGGAG
jgi:hypothetical protein